MIKTTKTPDQRWIGDLLGGPLMVRESRKIAELLLTEPDETTWQQHIMVENILQVSSANTANRYARTLRLRLMMLDPTGWQVIANGSESERQQLLLVALMLHSPIVADFIAEKLNSARLQFKEKLPADCWPEFVEEQRHRHPELSNFSDSSIKKMGNNLVKALTGAGYLDTPRRRHLQAVFLLPDTALALQRLGKTELMAVMEGKT